MERTITQIRAGAGVTNQLRFMHRPAFHNDPGDPNVGTYLSYCPSNVDVLALSVHPYGPLFSTDADITAFFNGTMVGIAHSMSEFLAAATTRKLPIAFPEWSPEDRNTSEHNACPIADTFVRRFYNEILTPNAANLVCDCVFSQSIRSVAYFNGATGATEWSDMVTNRKSLWSGIQHA